MHRRPAARCRPARHGPPACARAPRPAASRHVEARRRRADQHDLLGCRAPPRASAAAQLATKAPNEKPAMRQRALGRHLRAPRPACPRDSPRPSSCSPSLAPTPRKLKRTAVQPHCDEGARQRLHHLVVHGAAEQRMRMGDHRHAARRRAVARLRRAAPRWRRRRPASRKRSVLGVHARSAAEVRAASAGARRPCRSSGATRRSRRCRARRRRCTRPPPG